MRILGLPGGILQFPVAFQIKNAINCPLAFIYKVVFHQMSSWKSKLTVVPKYRNTERFICSPAIHRQ